jgi:cytoskeleton protein RodZ
MRFNDDSWVEVRQADGKILMSQLNHAGAGKALDGAPPLELVIGNAPGVALLYRGSTVDLAPYTRDRVAHITLK